MKAWIMTETGAPDVFQLVDSIPRKAPEKGEVMIRVCAAGFNPIDTKIRAGLAPIAPESRVLGCDVSGIIESVGEGVTTFNVGDAVYGLAGGVKGMQGALAEYITTDAALVAKAPDSVRLEECAALPVAAVTAMLLMERLQIKAGDSLYICGASGAVGLMATQLAVLKGATVTGSAGDEQRMQRVSAYGANPVLHEDAADYAASFNKVIDTFGGPGLQAALMLAQPFGQVATINARGEHELGVAHARSLTLHAIFSLLPLLSGEGRDGIGQALNELSALIDKGKIEALPVEVTGMSEVKEIHARYERGELKEKTVFLPDF